MATLKLPRFWPAHPAGRASGATARNATNGDVGLDAFRSEVDVGTSNAAPAPAPSAKSARGSAVAKWTVIVLLCGGVAAAGAWGYPRRLAPAAPTGLVTIVTDPSGLEVVIRGKSVGKTPLTTSLAPGAYDVQVGAAAAMRVVTVNVTAGTSIVHHVEFAREPRSGGAGTRAGLRVQTEPARLAVIVDGKPRGVSPVALDDLEPGAHEVSVRTSAGVVRRPVSLKPGETMSLVISSIAPPMPESPAVAAGWMSVSSAVPLQLREGGKLIGTSEADRLMLPAGDHEIEFSNPALGFTARKTVRVAAGKTAATIIDLPLGAISVNAQPWAEVWIDGERVGETPIGNLSRAIGPHEVVFRHPELGERRETVVVVVGKPARIGVDLRKK